MQTSKLSEVTPELRIKEAIWNNTNVYTKQITAKNAYWGPLTLKNFTPLNNLNKQFYDHPPVFSDNISGDNIEIIQQNPDKLVLNISKYSLGTIHILQNDYPGWRAYFNKLPVAMTPSLLGGMEIKVEGRGKLEITYRKNELFILIIITNLLVAFFTFFFILKKMRADVKSFSLSSQFQ
ncbi:MAG: hypothetical protein NVS1B13_23910 [Flavisolibacter sp.]